MKVSRALLASFPWTHYVRIEKVENGKVKTSSRHFDGTRLTRPIVETYDYNSLLPLSQCQGQWSWAEIEDGYLANYSQPYSGIDKISWYHLRRSEYAIKELFRAWVTLSTISPITHHQIADGMRLCFTEGICRLHQKEGQYTLQNGILATRALPQAVIEGISNLPIRQVIDSPLFPECAIAVEADGTEEETHIRYDVEVIDLERIFAKKSHILTLSNQDAIPVRPID